MKIIKELFVKYPKIAYPTILIVGLVLFFFIFTFPLAFNFKHSVPAVHGEDTRYFIWNLWQFRHTVFDLNISPFDWSKLVYYPVGFSQAATAYDNLYNTVLSVPLYSLVKSDIVVYNLLLLFNVILSGLGMYLLINRLFSKDKRVSLLVAFAFAFSPFAVHRMLGHINLATLQWIPFFLLYFLLLLESPKLKYVLLSALFLFLVGVSSWHYLVYMFFLVAFLLIYKTFFEKEKAVHAKKLIIYVFYFCLFIDLTGNIAVSSRKHEGKHYGYIFVGYHCFFR